MKSRSQVQCGEVWQASLDPIIGHKQGETRPVMVVSSDQFNQRRHGLCVIAPITSRIRNNPMHVTLDAPEGGLTVRSVVMCDQLRTVTLDRLEFRRGFVHATTLVSVRELIQLVFDI